MTPRVVIVASASVLAFSGFGLLFAPSEIGRLVAGSDIAGATPFALQLWAAALLGLAATDWVGRGLVLGGIYGRALVMGNLVHWMVGALVGVRAVIDRPSEPVLWVTTVVYGVFALLFYRMLRRHPGPEA